MWLAFAVSGLGAVALGILDWGSFEIPGWLRWAFGAPLWLGGQSLALWVTTVAVFIASGIVVKKVVWKITSDTAGRLVTVVVYGVFMLVTYVVIAFGILLAFDC